MMKETLKSYKSDNRGSAIITGLVVSTVLMVLCLSLLLVAYSFFISTYKSTSDLPNREMLYSAAEALEHELTEYTLEYEEGAEPALPADHALWNYVYTNIWQGFDAVAGKESVYAQDESNGYWLYFNENDPSANHRDKEKCSRYFNLSSLGNVKIVVQLYWQLPKGTDVNAINTENKDGTLLNAIYRMYDNKGNVIVKTERTYLLSYTTDLNTSSGSGEGSGGNGGGNSSSSTVPVENGKSYHLYGNDGEVQLDFKQYGPQSAQLTIKNTTNKKINSWKLYFFSEDKVIIGDTRYLTDLGNGVYIIQNPDSYTGSLEVGASTTVSIQTTFNYLPRAMVVEDVMQPLPNSDFQVWIDHTGNISTLTIKNNSGKTINGWDLEFDYLGDIYTAYPAKFNSNQSGHFLIQHVDESKTIVDKDSIAISLNLNPSYTGQPTNVILKTFSLTALEDLNQTVVNTVKYKWNRIGEDIINPGGGN